MNRYRLLRSALQSMAFVAALSAVSVAPGAEIGPSATLRMTSENAGVLIGWHDGQGILTLKDGTEYEVTMDAYSIPSIGYARSTIEGKIYYLKNAADFAGEYFTTGQSSSFRDGKGDAVFTNDKNVRIELVSKESGVRAGLTFGSATFRLGRRIKGPDAPDPVATAAPTTPVTVTPLPTVKKEPEAMPVAQQAVAKEPDPKEPVVATPVQYTLTFGFNKSRVNLEMGRTLDEVIREWKGKAAMFHVIGHADTVGSDTFNTILSQKRANAVKQALGKRGIPLNDIVAVGVGRSIPAVATQKGQRLRANRRVVLTVLESKR